MPQFEVRVSRPTIERYSNTEEATFTVEAPTMELAEEALNLAFEGGAIEGDLYFESQESEECIDSDVTESATIDKITPTHDQNPPDVSWDEIKEYVEEEE